MQEFARKDLLRHERLYLFAGVQIHFELSQLKEEVPSQKPTQRAHQA